MKLFFHYCLYGFSNCYILGTDFSEDPSTENDKSSELREAIIIDPGSMDDQILRFIEVNNYALRGILITHDHPNHIHGIKTLKKVYNADIYAVNHIISDFKTKIVRDDDTFNIGPFKIQVISVPGHSSDSAVYKIEQLLFTGDALTTGLVGTTPSSYGADIQVTALRSKILSLQGNLVVLPGHGPPSSLEAERKFNIGINLHEQTKNRRNQIQTDFL
ncbi:MAG: MBL fold metallo-hydrolase [Treponema sp.]|jgi:glyoxylase-like metal-dependent hydrolase (beta-lactamase superfamily II)|nr:MBL fold metallo-hydrolase [Treponema sp.]